MQGQSHARSDQRSVDADVPLARCEEQLRLIRDFSNIPPFDGSRDKTGEFIMELAGERSGSQFDDPLSAFSKAGV